jgi:hypothetical protein
VPFYGVLIANITIKAACYKVNSNKYKWRFYVGCN